MKAPLLPVEPVAAAAVEAGDSPNTKGCEVLLPKLKLAEAGLLGVLLKPPGEAKGLPG